MEMEKVVDEAVEQLMNLVKRVISKICQRTSPCG
jgi:hypothetical protein